MHSPSAAFQPGPAQQPPPRLPSRHHHQPPPGLQAGPRQHQHPHHHQQAEARPHAQHYHHHHQPAQALPPDFTAAVFHPLGPPGFTVHQQQQQQQHLEHLDASPPAFPQRATVVSAPAACPQQQQQKPSAGRRARAAAASSSPAAAAPSPHRHLAPPPPHAEPAGGPRPGPPAQIPGPGPLHDDGTGAGAGPGPPSSLAAPRRQGPRRDGHAAGGGDAEGDGDGGLAGGDGGDAEDGAGAAPRSGGPRIVQDPPDLQAWRERLFNVDDMIVLSNEQYETYFPHIDNVYSHRSTQRYKRKPFVSHYWDCRMKGRPPGTPKSDDPNKRKRKRSARERDLCNVKIKITEYFPGATLGAAAAGPPAPGAADPAAAPLGPGPGPGADGRRFWTIQRVNGNGGNGKGDGVAGPHTHTLEKSDEIKKSSVQRWLAGREKEARTTQRGSPQQQGQQLLQQLQPAARPRRQQRRPTGAAGATAKRHARESDVKLYAACFCPFSQRVWIALEAKGLPYQYCETDPFAKPRQLLEANPRGLVPAIRKGDWACGESSVILEYLEDLDGGGGTGGTGGDDGGGGPGAVRLFPTEPRLRANCRLWIDHVNRRVVPSFYALLGAAERGAARDAAVERLQRDIGELVQAADEAGPYFLGARLCLVDVHLAPFAVRLSRVLRPLRDWTDPAPGTRWAAWVEALEADAHVRATTAGADLYLDTAELLARAG